MLMPGFSIPLVEGFECSRSRRGGGRQQCPGTSTRALGNRSGNRCCLGNGGRHAALQPVAAQLVSLTGGAHPAQLSCSDRAPSGTSSGARRASRQQPTMARIWGTRTHVHSDQHANPSLLATHIANDRADSKAWCIAIHVWFRLGERQSGPPPVSRHAWPYFPLLFLRAYQLHEQGHRWEGFLSSSAGQSTSVLRDPAPDRPGPCASPRASAAIH